VFQGASGGFKGLQRDSGCFSKLHGDSECFRGLQGASGCFRGLRAGADAKLQGKNPLGGTHAYIGLLYTGLFPEGVSSMLLSCGGLSSYLGRDTEVKVSYL
jgi:hypothetical protein